MSDAENRSFPHKWGVPASGRACQWARTCWYQRQVAGRGVPTQHAQAGLLRCPFRCPPLSVKLRLPEGDAVQQRLQHRGEEGLWHGRCGGRAPGWGCGHPTPPPYQILTLHALPFPAPRPAPNAVQVDGGAPDIGGRGHERVRHGHLARGDARVREGGGSNRRTTLARSGREAQGHHGHTRAHEARQRTPGNRQ